MSKEHFKTLYEIAKNDGPVAALKYDAAETLKRHPEAAKRLAPIATIASLFYKSAMYTGEQMALSCPGLDEMTVDENNEPIRYATYRGEKTTISEKMPNGKWEKYVFIETQTPNWPMYAVNGDKDNLVISPQWFMSYRSLAANFSDLFGYALGNDPEHKGKGNPKMIVGAAFDDITSKTE